MQPVFIIGYPRSGTTLLLHFLMSSGQFPKYNFDETHFFSHHYKRYGRLSDKKNVERFKEALSKSEFIKNSEIGVESIIDGVDGDGDKYGNVFKLAMQEIAGRQGFSRWLEKTPWHMLYIPEIKKAIPDAKFILIVRDARDVVFSVDNYGWNEGLLKSVLRSAISWRWHMKTVLRDLKMWPGDFTVIRYEDLVVNPKVAADRISGLLNIEIDLNKIKEDGRGVLIKSNSSYSGAPQNGSMYRWKEIEDQGVLAEIDYILSDFLQVFGYESSGAALPSRLDRLRVWGMVGVFSLVKLGRKLMFPLVRK